MSAGESHLGNFGLSHIHLIWWWIWCNSSLIHQRSLFVIWLTLQILIYLVLSYYIICGKYVSKLTTIFLNLTYLILWETLIEFIKNTWEDTRSILHSHERGAYLHMATRDDSSVLRYFIDKTELWIGRSGPRSSEQNPLCLGRKETHIQPFACGSKCPPQFNQNYSRQAMEESVVLLKLAYPNWGGTRDLVWEIRSQLKVFESWDCVWISRELN